MAAAATLREIAPVRLRLEEAVEQMEEIAGAIREGLPPLLDRLEAHIAAIRKAL